MLRLSMALFGSSFPSQIITSVPSALSSRQISHCLKRPQAEQYLYLIPVRTSNVNKCWQIRALRDWKEYEEAVQEKDLSRALQFLESLDYLPLETSQKSTLNQQKDRQDDGFVAESSVRTTPVSFLQPLRNREILDACLNAEDMKLVGRTYAFLQRRGFLPNFGKFKNIVAEGPRNVTPAVLKASTGLEASKLSPKKWGLSGSSAPILFATLVGFSYLLNNGIDLRPKLAVILGLGILDAIYLGGTGLAQVLSLWPPYKRRILVHEAGHLLTAYLLGCPIRGVILDPVLAMQMGIQGQAGTQFWDETLESELVDGRLTSTSFDRYCMVLFAGIASEALMYGEAEGGENDENLFKAIVSVLRPPWSPSQMSNQARWAVQQSYNLLREHRSVLIAAVRALEKSNSLGFVIKKIEDAMPSK